MKPPPRTVALAVECDRIVMLPLPKVRCLAWAVLPHVREWLHSVVPRQCHPILSQYLRRNKHINIMLAVPLTTHDVP
jgi:hypothetical protein